MSFGPGGFLYTGGTMADKSYKSYRQQLNILRSRGMVIGKSSQGSRVMRILERENSFKTVIAHEFSAKYGHDNYLKIENFDNSTERNISSSIKLIGDIQQEIARQMSKHHQVVTHYMTEHGYIPLWVLVNVLIFGKIENFYKFF